MKMRSIQLKDSLVLFSIIMVLISLIALAFNSSIRTSEEKRQIFENNLLASVANSNKIVIHNQGIIIHNQKQFSIYGMGHDGNATPDIRTDWINVTH